MRAKIFTKFRDCLRVRRTEQLCCHVRRRDERSDSACGKRRRNRGPRDAVHSTVARPHAPDRSTETMSETCVTICCIPCSVLCCRPACSARVARTKLCCCVPCLFDENGQPRVLKYWCSGIDLDDLVEVGQQMEKEMGNLDREMARAMAAEEERNAERFGL